MRAGDGEAPESSLCGGVPCRRWLAAAMVARGPAAPGDRGGSEWNEELMGNAAAAALTG
jgi:hypothetical protein